MKSRLTTLSASLWGCELKCQIIHTRTQIIKVSLLVRLWVEIPTPRTYHVTCSSSASLWGCELKCLIPFCYKPVKIVSLLVRLWVEMVRFPVWQAAPTCQPPCEAVSWNTSKHSPVSLKQGQPPCEAVSWNGLMSFDDFVSIVSLLVRLLVEMLERLRQFKSDKSASLWGCELKYLSCNLINTLVTVSLLVRLWVEIRKKKTKRMEDLVSLLVRLWVEISLSDV